MTLNLKTLRVALVQRDLTLKQVAEQSGLDLLRLYRITSKNVRPRTEELRRLADVLGVEPGDLVRNKDTS